jgi:micrococcal nuclease
MGRWARYVGVCSVLLTVVVGTGTRGASASVVSGPRERTAVLAEVSDGDTLELRDGTRVRLIGIDTPETQHPEFGDECYGHAATRFARRLLQPGDRVRLVLDVETRDRYGRLLAYVYRASDDLFVNAEIVRQGCAYVSTIPPNVAHAEQFRHLAAGAREARRGLWSKCYVKGTQGGQRPPPSSKGPCLPQYKGACVPPPPPDYDCGDFDGPITVTGDDVHHLDSDGDGIACTDSG